MSNQYINFYYDPVRQGFDSEEWSLISGLEPVAAGGVLAINNSTIYHYGDIIRGDFVYNLVIPTAPTSGDNRIFGLYQYSKGAYLAFNITGAVFSATSGDGNGNTNSVAITWQSAWTATATEFRIKWEAGLAHFFVGGVQQAAISDASISGDPMSLYVSNVNTDNLNLKYVDAKGIQSYYMNTPLSGSVTFGRSVSVNEVLTITESVTVLRALLVLNLITDTLTVTESVTLGSGVGFLMGPPNVSEALAITENLTMFTNRYYQSVVDTLTVSESVTMSLSVPVPAIVDTLTYTEFVGLQAPF